MGPMMPILPWNMGSRAGWSATPLSASANGMPSDCRAGGSRRTMRGSGAENKAGAETLPWHRAANTMASAMRVMSPAAAHRQASMPSPSLQYTTPGNEGGMADATGDPRISTDCMASRTRRHSPSVIFAFISEETCPAGCCVQAMTCMPSERPSEAICTMRFTTSGSWSRSAWNSSITTTSRGGAECSMPMSCAWPSATRRSRCFSSSSNACSARTACCRSRSHTLPTQCGSRSSGRNAVPPLKSRNTNCRRFGGLRAARARHQLCNNTDLPDPVVPATSACGPCRCRSRWATPCCVNPMGTSMENGCSHCLATVRQGRRSSLWCMPSSGSRFWAGSRCRFAVRSSTVAAS